MNISIIGASGFLGKNLISYLLLNTEHNISAIALDTKNIIIEDKYKNRVKIIEANAFNYNDMKVALIGTDVAFYFIHMLCYKNNFYKKESEVAHIVGKALYETNVKKVIYMSGLGNDQDKLSDHLSSRHKTGQILSEYINQVIEFRASMIIGSGSASFEIIRDIVSKAPFIILPSTAKNETQPIGLSDALLYLTSSINLINKESLIIEIGGPETMSYQELLEEYGNFINKKVYIIIIPFLTKRLAGLLLGFFTSKDRSTIGQNMVESFKNKMIVTNNKAIKLYPKIIPKKIKNSFF